MDTELIVSKLRDWLTETHREIEQLTDPTADTAQATADPQQTVGLLQLAEAFTALRHEVKLQTRASRGLETTIEQACRGLESASQSFHSVQAREKEAGERSARPLIDLIVSLDESLIRAIQVFSRTASSIHETQSASLSSITESVEQAFSDLPAWKRWLLRNDVQKAQRKLHTTLMSTRRIDLSVLMQGFEQIQNRLTRSLSELGIQRISSTGIPVDPTRMQVIELVPSKSHASETVLEVVRPGYVIGDRVIRFAEVRATVRTQAEETSTPS
ncbi:MAG: nucleotide exchange factor GrpE [Planctomyces sp.]|nr:nucleotide exchange factor GrpE [Planctomyces sp.]